MLNGWIVKVRVVVVVAALVVGVVLPIAAAAIGEDTLPTTLLVLLPTRCWWATAVVCAVAVVVCAFRYSRFFALLPPCAVLWATWTGVMVRDTGVVGPRIASWNLAKGQIGSRQQLLDGLRSFDADVVCVSEAGVYDWLPQFDVDGIARELGMTASGTGETRALSRLPVLAFEEVPLPPGPARRPLVVVDIEKAGQRYRIGCLHLMPRLLFVHDSVDRGAARTGSWSAIAAGSRSQGRTLHDVLVSEGDVDLVMGDWNNQPWGRIVGGVKAAGYVDVFGGSGDVTFGDGLIAKRIDLALVRDALWVSEASIRDVAGSDHKALVVNIGPWRGR